MSCPYRKAPAIERRPANALNLEIGAPLERCTAKPPAHWPSGAGHVLRWLGSGGSVLVFGACSPNDCPLEKDK